MQAIIARHNPPGKKPNAAYCLKVYAILVHPFRHEANMATTTSNLIIHGLTLSGRTFRPSDWAERLSGVMSTFGGDHRMSYSPYVKPLTYEGVKSVAIDKRLQEVDVRAFDFLLNFARDNGLQVLEDSDTST